MKYSTVYAAERFVIKGADPEQETTLSERSYLVETDFDLRFHVLLSYNSEITFLCARCDRTYVPTWWQRRNFLEGYTVLHSRGPGLAQCTSCAQDYTLSFLHGEGRRNSFPTSYHGRFMWSADFKAYMGRALERFDGINVFESILVLDEMAEALMAIKGPLESERIMRDVYHRR